MTDFMTKRITKELAKLETDKIEGIALIDCKNIMVWHVEIKGPPDTPYENGVFKMLIRFENSDYPVRPPSVKFITPMYHPNIYRDGKICIDILQQEWSPIQTIRTILISIMSLLNDPNPASPANREAAELYNKNRDEYNNKVREHVIANKDIKI